MTNPAPVEDRRNRGLKLIFRNLNTTLRHNVLLSGIFYPRQKKVKHWRHKSGFSLAELLVAIIVLSILILLSISCINGIFQNSKNLKCIGNLRNLSAALNSYITDRGYYPGALANEGSVYWHQALEPYLSTPATVATSKPSSVFWCPGRSNKDGALVSYGYNHMGFGYSPTSIGGGPKLPASELPPKYWKVRPSKIENPSKRIVIGDSLEIDTGGPTAAPFIYKAALYQAIRHHGGGNYVWADGHVGWITPKDLASADSAGVKETPYIPFQ